MSKSQSISSKIIIIFLVLSCVILFIDYSWSAVDARATLLQLHYARGVKLYKIGNYENAEAEFQRVLEIEPNHKKAQKYLSASTHRKNKKIVLQLYKDAKAYYAQRDYEKALETYQKVLELIPDDGYALYHSEILRAKIEKINRLRQKKEEYKLMQSKKELERINKEKKKKEKILQKQAAKELKRQEKEQRKKKPETLAKQTAEEAKVDSNLAKSMAMQEEINALEEARLREEAEIKFQQNLAEKEKLYKTAFLFELGREYFDEGDYEKAIKAFQDVIESEAEGKTIYTSQAKEYIQKSKEKLIEEIEKIE